MLPELLAQLSEQSYQVLARRAESGAGLRASSLLNDILQLDFRGRDFRDRLVQWETLVRKQVRQQPRNVLPLPDNVEVAIVTSGITGDLKKQLLARAMSFADYPSLVAT